MFATDPQNPPQAISAVKALALANAGGQRIYQVTPANQAATLPNIRHDAGTMAEIRAALAVGKTVITHTDPVSVPGWSGAGYIILDPDTGEGAYRIGGAINGGLIILSLILIVTVIAILAVLLAPSVLAGLLVAVPLMADLAAFSLTLNRIAESGLSREEKAHAGNQAAAAFALAALSRVIPWRLGGIRAVLLGRYTTVMISFINRIWFATI